MSFSKKVSVGNSQAVGMLMRVTGLDLGESEAIVYSDENKRVTYIFFRKFL